MNRARLPTLSRGARLDTPASFSKHQDPLAPPVASAPRSIRLKQTVPGGEAQQLRRNIAHLERVLAERRQHAVTGLPLAVRTVDAVGDMVGDKKNTLILKITIERTVRGLIDASDGAVSLPGIIGRPAGVGTSSARFARQDVAALNRRRDWLCRQIAKHDVAIRYMVFFVEHGTGLLERSLNPMGDLQRKSDAHLRGLLEAPKLEGV